VPSVNKARTHLIQPPFLPTAPVLQHMVAAGWPHVWWVGCHGGSGATTLAGLTKIGCDFGTAWPVMPPTAAMIDVILVFRASATGTWAATGAVEQWRRRSAPVNARVRGIVAVAASARRPPKIVDERLQLLKGWVPNLWKVGWQEVLLAADEPSDVGLPPDVAALRDALLNVSAENAKAAS
jgi:hypothetical protein